jgi:hypothetical protein
MRHYTTAQRNKLVVCQVALRVICPPRADSEVSSAESIADMINARVEREFRLVTALIGFRFRIPATTPFVPSKKVTQGGDRRKQS